MGYTSPRTWATGETPTAAQFNTEFRDNLLDFHRRTTSYDHLVSSSQSTAGTSFGDLATVGPQVSVEIGTTGQALVALYGVLNSSLTGANFATMGVAVTGATTVAAADNYGLAVAGVDGVRFGGTFLFTALNAGVNTFTCKYKSNSGSNTATFKDRRLLVTPLGS